MRLFLEYEKSAAKKMPGSLGCDNQLVGILAALGNCSITGTLCTAIVDAYCTVFYLRQKCKLFASKMQIRADVQNFQLIIIQLK
jgi:hypothetical protein